MQTYVVRIYRRGDPKQTPKVAGTVEPVPGGRRLAFDGLQQLATLLALPDARGEKHSGSGGMAAAE